MTGWWRRNAIPLIALTLLVPATAVAVLANEWGQYFAERASRPITAEPGATITYGGAQLGPAVAEFTTNESAPSGTRVVSVTLEIDPADSELSCLTPRLREIDGSRRQWDEASYDLDFEWDPDATNLCDPEATAPYALTLNYLVPDDASGPFAVEVESASALPEFARIVVEP